MSQDNQKTDYLDPGITELAPRRRGEGIDPNVKIDDMHQPMTGAVARRLLPACVAVPAVLWWVLLAGEHRGWYQVETCFVLFVFSVAVVFGLIVCFNLRKLSKMDKQRAQAQEQLKVAKEAAEAANRFKSVFFANISHEIRTPLTAINGFAELLLNSQRTDQERRSDALVIRRNGEHLLTLINDILDLSKIEAGKMSVDRIMCNPAQIIGEVCSMLRHRAAEKSLSLDVKFEGAIPKMIRTDPTRLRQVLINLIANAVKFTKAGGVQLNVTVKQSTAEPLLEVKISDTGIGIAPDRQAALFQPFVQGDASIARQYGGSGLGLAISQHFARALGGDITVESRAGRGSTFTVTVGTDSLHGSEIQENPEEAMDMQNDFAGPKVRISGSILVAEDGIDNQALIAAKLRETGLKLEIAPNGQIAFDTAMSAMLNGKPFDLILMDVQMPVMDGFTATMQLRSKGYRGPIIALTANAMERDRDKCLNAGCNDFVTKPIKMESLFKAIGKHLKVTKAADEPAKMSSSNFFQSLPGEIAQLEEAIERQDRTQLKEVAQLVLGTAAAAGLKDVAPEAAKLVQAAESEKSWILLGQAVADFAGEFSKQQSRAA